MRRALRRAAAFALVPLSAIPLIAVAPLVAPSIEQRVHELTHSDSAHHAPANPAPQNLEGSR
ncbi:MAG TPA: hypothetical protein VGM91_11725 [Conexibacter sp.]|jgi:hypothetical protein